MTDAPSTWRITCARIAAAGLIVALAPLPLAAAESTLPLPSIDFAAAVRKSVAAERLTKASPAQTARPADAAVLQSPSFFKTPLGLAVIAVVGSGAAYAVYSAQHDRIHSQAR